MNKVRKNKILMDKVQIKSKNKVQIKSKNKVQIKKLQKGKIKIRKTNKTRMTKTHNKGKLSNYNLVNVLVVAIRKTINLIHMKCGKTFTTQKIITSFQ